MLLICQNLRMQLCGAQNKIYYFLCSKTYSTIRNLSWSPASSWQAARSAHICETNLLWIVSLWRHCHWISKYCSTSKRCTIDITCLVTFNQWGRVTHICCSKIIIIDSHNGLSPGRHQIIIWTNAGILLIGSLGTNFGVIFKEIHTFSFKKIN